MEQEATIRKTVRRMAAIRAAHVAEIEQEQQRRERQLQIAKRGFELAECLLDAVARGMGWEKLPPRRAIEFERHYQMPTPPNEKPWNYTVEVSSDPWGDDNALGPDEVWIPEVFFGFGDDASVSILLTDETLSFDRVESHSLFDELAEALVETYGNDVRRQDFGG